MGNLILIGGSLVLKRKKKREYAKDLKIERGVFDRRTMLILYNLLNKNIIEEVIGITKEGKESIILAGKAKDNYVAIKIYRTEACNFKTMWKYLVGDPRFFRVKKARRSIVNMWCQREFKNLMIATKARVTCPKPIAFKENILIMSFIGEKDIPAPMLVSIRPPNPKKVYEDVLKNMKKLTKANLIHGDLSAYNILYLKKPFFIDFSHGITSENQLAPELLERDIKNINSYFSKLNTHVKDSKTIYNQLIKLIRKK